MANSINKQIIMDMNIPMAEADIAVDDALEADTPIASIHNVKTLWPTVSTIVTPMPTPTPTPSQKTPVYSSSSSSSSHRLQAKMALQAMKSQDRMTTPFTNREQVLQRGFPSNLQWRPCALQRIIQQKNAWPNQQDHNDDKSTTINIALLGGSTAAWPGSHCPAGVTDGKYSHQLQHNLHQSARWHKKVQQAAAKSQQQLSQGESLQFEVRNYAQGGTTSVYSGLLLDGYLHPNKTDIIIWDFLVNEDAAEGGEEEQIRALDFWLTRVYAHFTQAGKPPPPIVLLCLWGMYPRDKLVDPSNRNSKNNVIDRQPERYLGPLIERYNQHGWNIAILNVGATVNTTAVSTLETAKTMLDDRNHPSCTTTGLIADMIQHQLFTNLLGDDNGDNSCSLQQPQPPTLPLPHKQVEAQLTNPTRREHWAPLWKDLFNTNARIGSISLWEPVESNQTNLHVMQDLWQTQIHNWPQQMVGKHTHGRLDVKMGLLIPRCQQQEQQENPPLTDTSKMLNLRIQEPHLKWIGLNIHKNNAHVYVNGIEMDDGKGISEDWAFGQTHVYRWIDLKQHDHVKADKHGFYTISFCQTWTNNGTDFEQTQDFPEVTNLSFLIGVMIQDDDHTNDEREASSSLSSSGATVLETGSS